MQIRAKTSANMGAYCTRQEPDIIGLLAYVINFRKQSLQTRLFLGSILRAARTFALLRLSYNKQFITWKVVQYSCILIRQFYFFSPEAGSKK